MGCVGAGGGGGVGENEFKNSSSLAACQEEEETAKCRSKQHRVVFFFSTVHEKEMNLKITQKWVMIASNVTQSI
jgi:hypothetical protein